MAYKDILVHIDSSLQSEGRINLAISLAIKHKAHLTALYIISHSHYTPQLNNAEEIAEKAISSFYKKALLPGITTEAVCIDTKISGVDITEALINHSYYKDLVIIGQPDPSLQQVSTPPDLPERLILGAGRPVLTIPYSGKFESAGERIAVAWKSGRESVRALNDAMPFLLTAKSINLLEIVTPAIDNSGSMSASARIARHLSNHSITVKIDSLVSGNIPVGDVLLNQAWEVGGDLLVMGAFKNINTGKPELGPIARHILQHMTLPVLMSH